MVLPSQRDPQESENCCLKGKFSLISFLLLSLSSLQ